MMLRRRACSRWYVQNQERFQQLHQLTAACECDEEVQALLQKQLQNMKRSRIAAVSTAGERSKMIVLDGS